MPEPEGSPETENTQEESTHNIAKRAARLLGAGAAVTGALVLAGSQPNKSVAHEIRTATTADTAYQNIGKNGSPAPRLIPTESHDPIVEKIIFARSNNPYDLARQAIWLAAHPETYGNKLSVLSMYPGYIEATRGSLYHWLKGSRSATPANPSNNGEEGKITATPDKPIWIENPVIWTGYVNTPGEPSFAIVTPANGPSDVRDLNNVYFWNLNNPANYYASKRFYNPNLGLAEPPMGGIPTIGTDGEFSVVGEEQKDLSKFFTLTHQQADETMKKLGLIKAQAP